MAQVEQETVLRLQRRFDASRERVWDAWTSPEVLGEWWAAAPTMTPGAIEVDLREGGRYRLSMREEGGMEHVVVGEYREVRPPERLAFTWTWESNAPQMAGSADTLVEIEFAEEGDATTVTLTHSGFATEEIKGLHAHGWEGCLASLEQHLGRS